MFMANSKHIIKETPSKAKLGITDEYPSRDLLHVS